MSDLFFGMKPVRAIVRLRTFAPGHWEYLSKSGTWSRSDGAYARLEGGNTDGEYGSEPPQLMLYAGGARQHVPQMFRRLRAAVLRRGDA